MGAPPFDTHLRYPSQLLLWALETCSRILGKGYALPQRVQEVELTLVLSHLSRMKDLLKLNWSTAELWDAKYLPFESRGFEVGRVPNAATATAENVRYKGEFDWLVLRSGIKNSRQPLTVLFSDNNTKFVIKKQTACWCIGGDNCWGTKRQQGQCSEDIDPLTSLILELFDGRSEGPCLHYRVVSCGTVVVSG